jgi:hypothetical protein
LRHAALVGQAEGDRPGAEYVATLDDQARLRLREAVRAVYLEPPLRDDPITRVCKEMEIITTDGRCAGHVSRCSSNQIFTIECGPPIPKEWIRRVDREFYISKRWYELVH